MLSSTLVYFSILLVSSSAFAAPDPICDQIAVLDGELKLNKNERVLVCGSDSGGEGWSNIPIPQATLHLKAILQNQGFLQPRFERKGDSLNVWKGARTTISNLRVNGADGVLHAEKKRKIVGAPLEPKKLNEVEAWVYGEIRSQGYACAQVKVEAHEWDGEVVANVNLETQKRVGTLDVGTLDGLDPAIINRYRPFESGDIYDIRKTQLLTSRLLDDGLFQGANVTAHCHEDVVDLKLETSIGKPKIFRFGVGASTEELPFLDATFKNARLDGKASSFLTGLHVSPRKVSFSVDSELYWIPGSTRSFFGPRFEAARNSENSYDTNTIKGGVDIGRGWDSRDIRFVGRWGAVLNYEKTIRGAGPPEVFYPSIEASLNMVNHDYEASVRDQYESWTAAFFYRGQNKGLGSQVDVNRYRVDAKNLWNIGGFSPPLFVLGARVQAIVVDADEINGTENRDLLPTQDRIYLGGDQNLRGFKRESINNNDLGFLTSVYFGLELRLIEELPYHLQPFLLWDIAKVGNQRYTLEQPIYLSEGIGLRWASPFGTFRGSLARGHVIEGNASTSGFPDRLFAFFSFGQEF